MIEVLWHGRGGQGAFTAARLLGAAGSLEDGRYALAFPSFGPERRGAPMRAFTKLSSRPIGDRSAIRHADFAVYLDETLLGADWERELKPEGRVLVNSERAFDDPRILAVPANRIAQEVLGRPIPNTVFLGVLAQLIDAVSLAAAKEAVRLYMPEKLFAKNAELVDRVAVAFQAGAFAGGAQLADAQAASGAQAAAAAGRTAGCVAGQNADARARERLALLLDQAPSPAARPDCAIPALQDDALDPARFARTTTFAAGHLVDRNAGWRNERPVVDPAQCTACLRCYMECPDGAIFKVKVDDATDAAVPADGRKGASSGRAKPVRIAIDYDFCKGCGVCVRACSFGALALYDEPLCRALEARAVPRARQSEDAPENEVASR